MEVAESLENVAEEGVDGDVKGEITEEEEDEDVTLGEEAMKEREAPIVEKSLEETSKKSARKNYSIFKSRNKNAVKEDAAEEDATEAGSEEKLKERVAKTVKEEEPKSGKEAVAHVKEVVETEKKASKKIATPVRVKNGAAIKEVRKSKRKSARTEEIFVSSDVVATENGSITPAEDEKQQVIITSISF